MNPYELLKAHASMDDAAIRRCYLDAMRQHHPDRGGETDVAASINRAYQTIKTARARGAYHGRLDVLGYHPCRDCDGAGYESVRVAVPGRVRGRRVEVPCRVCGGTGRVR